MPSAEFEAILCHHLIFTPELALEFTRPKAELDCRILLSHHCCQQQFCDPAEGAVKPLQGVGPNATSLVTLDLHQLRCSTREYAFIQQSDLHATACKSAWWISSLVEKMPQGDGGHQTPLLLLVYYCMTLDSCGMEAPFPFILVAVVLSQAHGIMGLTAMISSSKVFYVCCVCF